MGTPLYQYPTIVLPQAMTGVELVNDAVVHYSFGLETQFIQEKKLQVYCTEALGAPGNIRLWVELAPEDTAAYYTMLGVISVIVPTGVLTTTQGIILQWTTHSEYARLAVEAPGAGALAIWSVVGVFSGKT